jgi:hypothetical protein
MYRKTHSSDKDRSVLKEIKKEFSGTFSKGEERAVHLLSSYPKQIFISMVVVIIISSILAFVFTPLKTPMDSEGFFYEDAEEIKSGVSGEISTILDLSDRAKRLSILKSDIERVIKQKEITEEDSIFLENAIHELEYFNNQNKSNHED